MKPRPGSPPPPWVGGAGEEGRFLRFLLPLQPRVGLVAGARGLSVNSCRGSARSPPTPNRGLRGHSQGGSKSHG